MKIIKRPGSFFAKNEGTKMTLKERAAALLLKGKKSQKSENKLELSDRGTGTTIIFPNIGDVSEIVEGVEVTADDGTYTFEADGNVYTVEVAGGKVASVVEDKTGEDVMNAETEAFVQAVVEDSAVNEAFRTDAENRIKKLETDLAQALATVNDLKGKMSHKDDRGAGGNGGGAGGNGKIKVGDKEIDLSKINLK